MSTAISQMTNVKQVATKQQTRLVFLDNIRIYLTILVIFHHAALAYGGAGDWAVMDPAVDEISPIFLIYFNALNQTYFMSAFFLFAGYFTPRSFEKKGGRRFLADRLIRLGIPIVVYTTLIINLNAYIVDVIGRGLPFRWRVTYNPGHLWFLQALLLFAGLYVLFRVLVGQRASTQPITYFPESFPTDRVLLITIGVLAILTFLVRLLFPVGVWTFSFQLGHFVHYIFSFFVGVLAYRGDWFRHLPERQARRWGWIALGVALLFLPLSVLGGALEGEANVAKFAGGPYWQALVFSFWDTFLLIGINVFLLYFFRKRFDQAGPIGKAMAVNVFTVYIIHQTVLYLFQILMLPVGIPTIVKFFVVGVVATAVCFLLSPLIRRIPGARRVLG
jgi:glucan biosynthesis protein C